MDDWSVGSFSLPAGKKELRLCGAVAIVFVLMTDFLLFGGFYLGFAIASGISVIVAAAYLLRSGRKLTFYSGALLVMSLVIAASFARSNDAFMKLVMFVFLLLSAGLGLTLLAGQNRWSPAGILSVLDMPRTLLKFGLGNLSGALSGLNTARKSAGASGKKRLAFFAGLAVALPIVLVVIPLLISADAAFEGLVMLLPKVNVGEPVAAIVLGIPMGCVFYAMLVALQHCPKEETAQKEWAGKSALTINTALGTLCLVYAVYLLSQLAYVSGGLSGILPEQFTMAEYARRGFFEMATLSGINLLLMTVAVGLVERKNGKAPVATRCLLLFIGLMTLFFVVSASAKMQMYIASYGLTRLRVLTEVIMVFIGLTVVCVSVWLFLPKLPYMKVILLLALVMGAAVAWADVDTVVASYNVKAYQDGRLPYTDVRYLGELSEGALPYLAQLREDEDPQIAEAAEEALENYWTTEYTDFRSFRITGLRAKDILEEYKK